jgi:hypothetical protein
MKFSIGWLHPEVVTENTPGCRILDIRMQTALVLEYLEYPEGRTWYLVIQLFGFGICVNITREKE